MQNTSETWKSLAAGNGTYVESRAIINNVQYSDIEPPTITRALMQNGLEVGNVVSAMCTFTLDTTNVIPKSAEVLIEARLVGSVNGEAVNSEWLPQGTFFIAKRVRDPITGMRQFECYDALLKTNAVWEPASSTWPQQTEDILDEILLVIGLELDARTSITSYPISQPNSGTTMRDVLSVIAQHNGGNWIVTPDNKLRLVPIQDLNDVGEDVVEIESVIGEYYIGETNEISGIRVVSEAGDSLIGDETGAVVSVTIPEMIAVDLAEELIGKTYRPFSFGNAGYDIAAELGDYIQCEDAVSVIYAETITLGTTMHSDISAPDLAEIVDEYPYVGSSNKTLVAAKAYAQNVGDAAYNAAVAAASAQLAEAVVDINSDIEDLQSQIDGNITTWFYAVNPTLNNPPANAWTSDAEKNNHLGDLYYNTENGYCWRFMLANGQYSWQRISDTDITTALANAQRAQDTADGKRRVFVVQPTPPYDVGDLWVQGTSGDIMRCSTAKGTGAAYSQSDWVLASKYTDDTAVNTLNNALTQQEIFNRLTDNGAAQGLVLYNGQLYMNATYMRSGTIDGDSVNAKKFIVVDENNNVIASFDSRITLGKSTNTNVELDYNSFEIKSQSGSVFLELGDARDEQGVATVQDTYVGDGNNTNFLLHATPTTINSVKVDDVTVSNWSLSDDIVVMTTAPAKGAVVVITYITEQPVYHYTLGTRDPNDGIGIWSVAEGYYVGASGFASHAEGQATNAPGYISHAEGYYSTADGYAAHAEGYHTKASGGGSHAEGWETEASGTNSHTEGNSTEASGECGHAEGGDTVASGDYSHAEGHGTIASATAQHVVGKYNVSDSLQLEIVGNGTNDSNRSNARTLDESGNEWIAGALSVGNPGQTRANLGITPANIGAFGAGSVGTITDANNTSLYGSVMLEGSGCANLPSSSSGVFYQVEFFGTYQLASRHTAYVGGVSEVWARYYANGGWYQWVRIDGVDAVRTGDVANNLTTTEAGKVLDARQGNVLNTLIDGLISNTSLGTYSGYAAAAEAVWATMGNTSVKVGKIRIEVSGAGSYITVYLAVKSSANYAAVLFVSYSTTLHLAIKTSGTTTVRNISTTAG